MPISVNSYFLFFFSFFESRRTLTGLVLLLPRLHQRQIHAQEAFAGISRAGGFFPAPRFRPAIFVHQQIGTNRARPSPVACVCGPQNVSPINNNNNNNNNRCFPRCHARWSARNGCRRCH